MSLSKLYDRVRHPEASRVEGGAVSGFEHLRGHKYCLLVTYKRNGDAVPTPVWFALADGKLYTRSESGGWKLRRIANDPRVTIAPCSLRGKPLGPAAKGQARVLAEPAEEARAESALRANYSYGRKLYKAALGAASVDTTYIEVRPA